VAGIHAWLQRHVRGELDWSRFTSVAAAAVVAPAVLVLWAGIAAMLFVPFLGCTWLLGLRLDLAWGLVGAGVVAFATLVAASVTYLRAERACRVLAETGQGLGAAGSAIAVWAGVVAWLWAGLPGMASHRMRASAGPRDGERVAAGCLSLLFFPGQLLDGIRAGARRRNGLRALDIDRAAEVMGVALEAGRRVDCEALGRALPHVDIAAALHDLSLVRGVVFLPGPPPGVAIGERLRAELGALSSGAR
jgi:hypothetical protein